ncbi:MAG: hypothetical protein CM15mP88_3150 [Pseudomonadota bacterium]|nr:MAG: hypothetical protein CM15mP88_3150 [Pseudomonadota bacterium]
MRANSSVFASKILFRKGLEILKGKKGFGKGYKIRVFIETGGKLFRDSHRHGKMFVKAALPFQRHPGGAPDIFDPS